MLWKELKTREILTKMNLEWSGKFPRSLGMPQLRIYHLAKILRDIHPRVKVIVKDGSIYVNGQKWRQPVTPPSLQDTLIIDDNQADILQNVSFFISDLIGLKGSTFSPIDASATIGAEPKLGYTRKKIICIYFPD
jgi:hypothetical protein